MSAAFWLVALVAAAMLAGYLIGRTHTETLTATTMGKLAGTIRALKDERHADRWLIKVQRPVVHAALHWRTWGQVRGDNREDQMLAGSVMDYEHRIAPRDTQQVEALQRARLA